MGSVFSTPVDPDLSHGVSAPSPVDVFPPRWFRLMPEYVGLKAVFAADKWKPPARWSLLSTNLGPAISWHDYYRAPCPRITMPVSVYEAHLKEKERQVLQEPAIIMQELDRVMISIHEEVNYFGWRLPPYMIVAFVEAIQGALQYFKLGSFLRDKCISSEKLREIRDRPEESFCEELSMELKNMEDFNMVDEMAILHSLKEFRSNLISFEEARHNIIFLTHLVYSTIDWKTRFSAKDCNLLEEFPELEERVIEEGFHWCKCNMLVFGSSEEEKKLCLTDMIDKIHENNSIRMKRNKENDKLVAARPVYNLVFDVFEQQKAYVMDKDPGVEIQKSMLYDGWFSYHFMKDAPMTSLLYQARSVAVSKVPLNASAEDIKQLFPIWEIEHIQMEMESRQTSQIVFVVFKDLQGTEGALTMQGLAVHGMPVIIKPCLGYLQRQALSTYIKSGAADILSSHTENVKLEEAMVKYQWLTGEYLESRKKEQVIKASLER